MDSYISSFVYGGMDGLITTASLISGSIGSNQKISTTIILAFSGLIADALSMAAGSYESHLSDNAVNVSLITFISFSLLGSVPVIIYWIENKLTVKNEINFKSTYFSMICLLFIIGYVKGNYINVNPLISGVKTILLGSLISFTSYSLATKIDVFLRELS
jgi:VIT1/CCC1 family predicted Fe2+/Mn2+ transporter